MLRTGLSLTLLGAILLGAPAGQAAVTAKDVQVAGRVLGFLSPPPVSTLRVGIVFDPAKPQSLADERALLSLLGSRLSIAGITLEPMPVTPDQLASTDLDVMFLTSGLGQAGAAAAKAANTQRIPCVTTDIAATRAGFCAIAVQTTPNVQITVNSSALAASGVAFTTAFLLMVTEI